MTFSPDPTLVPSPSLEQLCSTAARHADADPAGTAAEFTEFLLIEHRQPWSRSVADDAVSASFPADAAKEVAARATLRPHAIRTVQRGVDADPMIIHGTVGSGSAMTRLATPALDAPGDPLTGLLFAVCTNGKRDRCCAQLGRPLAVALHSEFGDRVIEISHLGGHRFAATMLVLPWGYAYGFLDLPGARAILQAADRGLVEPRGLRGRADLPPAAQAAEAYWRRQLGPAAPDAVSAIRSETDRGEVLVTAVVGDRRESLWLTPVIGPQVSDTACGGKPFTADRWRIRES